MWYFGVHIIPADETSYTTQYKEAILNYVENKYSAEHRLVLVNEPENLLSSDLLPSAMTSKSGQSFFDPYDFHSDDEEYLIPNYVAETTPGWSNHTAYLLITLRLHLNSLSEAPKNQG